MTLSKNSNRPPAQSSQPDASSDDSLAPGVLIGGRYRIDTLLGEGAMGRVYAAEHVLLRKKLAIKILHGDRAQVPEVVARFEREAMAAANIEHPNIAGASDFGRLADGSVYLVLEYVQGVNLRDELRKGPFSTERSLHIARQIASALAGAQELAIVHRDLKPENIMLIEKHGDPDFVKVLDFGIARVPMAEGPNEPLTKVGIVFGTPEYMAPEQALGQRVDGRADLYALGVILFEMLAGVRPYPAGAANIARQLSGQPPKIADRAPHVLVSGAVEALVQKLLAPNVRDRFQSAKELLAALDASIPPAGAQRASTSPAQPTPPVGTPTGVRLPTFLPGDPLPAFELPADAPVPVLVRPRPPLASGDVVEPGA
ncbi:MAG TPA: serine/threonine-protein kinase, partial [Polyangiaceae bacterium]